MDRIKTDRLTLRVISMDDMNDIYRIYSSKEVCEFYDVEPFTELEQANDHIKRWLKFFDEKKQIRFAIHYSNYIIGTCGLYLINSYHKRACLGYELLPEYWGNGFASESIPAMLDYTVKHFGLQRIQAEVLPDNIASQKLLKKIGFKKEGLLKNYENWGEKGFVDLVIYSKIYKLLS